MLPIGFKDTKLGKWSPTWEGPFVISLNFLGGAYHLMDTQGNEHSRNMNLRYLKKYYPSIYEAKKKL